MTPDFYVRPAKLTALTAEQASAIGQLDSDPEVLCRAVQGVVVQPQEAEHAGLPEARLEEKNLRPVSALLRRVLELDGSPIGRPRPLDRRVVGTCRHFAVMACALLRAHGLPARARCGFATYFDPGKHLDHWITEYWSEPDDRWVRIDAEILGTDLVARPDRLADGEFLTGGEAWKLCRAGRRDPMTFGVDFKMLPELVGPAEIRGNAIRDLASLNKVEMLPWDEWGPMRASYQGTTGPEFDDLIDQVADACASEDHAQIHDQYAKFRVPDALLA